MVIVNGRFRIVPTGALACRLERFTYRVLSSRSAFVARTSDSGAAQLIGEGRKAERYYRRSRAITA
jgi:hypothetical protein